MFKKIALGLQIGIATLMWGGYALARYLLYTPMNNEMALKQMESSTSSYVMWKSYGLMWGGATFGLVLMTLLIFLPNIIGLFKKSKN